MKLQQLVFLFFFVVASLLGLYITALVSISLVLYIQYGRTWLQEQQDELPPKEQQQK